MRAEFGNHSPVENVRSDGLIDHHVMETIPAAEKKICVCVFANLIWNANHVNGRHKQNKQTNKCDGIEYDMINLSILVCYVYSYHCHTTRPASHISYNSTQLNSTQFHLCKHSTT